MHTLSPPKAPLVVAGAKTKGGVKGGNEQYIPVSVSLQVMG